MSEKQGSWIGRPFGGKIEWLYGEVENVGRLLAMGEVSLAEAALRANILLVNVGVYKGLSALLSSLPKRGSSE